MRLPTKFTFIYKCDKPKKISENIYQILGEDITEKFSIHLLKQHCSYNLKNKYAVAIFTSGNGHINGIPAKKGDRFIIKSESELLISGSEDFEAVIAE